MRWLPRVYGYPWLVKGAVWPLRVPLQWEKKGVVAQAAQAGLALGLPVEGGYQ